MFKAPMAKMFGMVSTFSRENAVTESIILKQFMSNEPDESLVLFPEGDSTNGKRALLR